MFPLTLFPLTLFPLTVLVDDITIEINAEGLNPIEFNADDIRQGTAEECAGIANGFIPAP